MFEVLVLKQLILSTNGITESQLDETVKKVLDNITNANKNWSCAVKDKVE